MLLFPYLHVVLVMGFNTYCRCSLKTHCFLTKNLIFSKSNLFDMNEMHMVLHKIKSFLTSPKSITAFLEFVFFTKFNFLVSIKSIVFFENFNVLMFLEGIMFFTNMVILTHSKGHHRISQAYKMDEPELEDIILFNRICFGKSYNRVGWHFIIDQ